MKKRILAALLAAMMLCTVNAAAEEAPAPGEVEGEPVVERPTPAVTVTYPSVACGAHNSWFEAEIADANSLGLIPERFAGADMRESMTRAEFAAVALRLYERMSGTTVAVPAANPFTDTADAEVLRACAAGLVNGVAPTEFAPDETVTRQQAATMLTRVYKALNWEGWTLAGDSTYVARTLDYEGVQLYADHAEMYDYATPSVYFLTKNGVVNGVGSNRFEPNRGCTREEGVALALRMCIAFA